jgi:glutathione S-transferase
MLKIHGVTFSAHTRKVLLGALEKGIAYELVPVIPLRPPPGWRALSPLGLIPAIEDDDLRLSDSSVILAYLERKQPEKALYPAETRAYARALWIEEFVDGGLAPHVLRGLLLQRVFATRFLNQAPDEALIQTSLTQMIPPRLDYLEQQLSGDFFAGTFSVADIAVASILVNFHYAGESVKEATHPRLYRHLRRVLARASFRTHLQSELPAASSVGGLDMSLFHE